MHPDGSYLSRLFWDQGKTIKSASSENIEKHGAHTEKALLGSFSVPASFVDGIWSKLLPDSIKC